MGCKGSVVGLTKPLSEAKQMSRHQSILDWNQNSF
jgi:hypothetical protein